MSAEGQACREAAAELRAESAQWSAHYEYAGWLRSFPDVLSVSRARFDAGAGRAP